MGTSSKDCDVVRIGWSLRLKSRRRGYNGAQSAFADSIAGAGREGVHGATAAVADDWRSVVAIALR